MITINSHLYRSGFRSGDSTVNQLNDIYNYFAKALDYDKDAKTMSFNISERLAPRSYL